MSAISSTGVGQTLYAFLQQSSGASQASSASTSSASATAAASTDPTSAGAAGGTSGTAPTHRHHRHGGGGHGGEFQKIREAVTSALQSAKADGSSDPNQAIQDAIANVLKQQSSATPAGGQGGAQAAGGNRPPGSPPADDGGTGTGNSTDKADSARQAFVQTLKSFGVDEQQFRNDFRAALQQAKGSGDVTPSAAFKSFPTGTAVDTTA